MRPWLAVLRGGRRSDSTSFRGTGSLACRKTVEALEPRTLLSAQFTAAFVDPFPSTLAAGEHARVTVRLFNQGDAAGARAGSPCTRRPTRRWTPATCCSPPGDAAAS